MSDCEGCRDHEEGRRGSRQAVRAGHGLGPPDEWQRSASFSVWYNMSMNQEVRMQHQCPQCLNTILLALVREEERCNRTEPFMLSLRLGYMRTRLRLLLRGR